jgi:hypothetical protein
VLALDERAWADGAQANASSPTTMVVTRLVRIHAPFVHVPVDT